jgi:hypothetical protein
MSSLWSLTGDLKVAGDITSTTFSGALQNYQDLFNRLKVSQPCAIFTSNALYKRDSRWEEIVSGGGSVSGPTNAAITHQCTGAGRVVCQTQPYFIYVPGRTQSFLMTGILHFPSAPQGAIFRIGSFDDKSDKRSVLPDVNESNGHYFEADNTTGTIVYNVVQRSTASGTLVELRIPRSSWNVDALDGNGKSKINIDFTKAQIFTIERAWLGVGVARLGVVIRGRTIWCHMFENENVYPFPYMDRATLPLRYELDCTAVITGTAKLMQICSSCYIENGFDAASLGEGRSLHTTRSSLGTGNNLIIALRLKSTTPRATFMPRNVTALYAGAGALTTVVVKAYRGSVLSNTGSWQSAGENNYVEYCTSGTIVSPGTLMSSSILGTSGTSLNMKFSEWDTFFSNIAGDVSTIFLIAMEITYGAQGCSGTVTVDWNEIA